MILTYHSKMMNGRLSKLGNGLQMRPRGRMNVNVQQEGHRNPCAVQAPTHRNLTDKEDGKIPHVPLMVVLAVAEGVDMEGENVVEEATAATQDNK